MHARLLARLTVISSPSGPALPLCTRGAALRGGAAVQPCRRERVPRVPCRLLLIRGLELVHDVHSRHVQRVHLPQRVLPGPREGRLLQVLPLRGRLFLPGVPQVPLHGHHLLIRRAVPLLALHPRMDIGAFPSFAPRFPSTPLRLFPSLSLFCLFECHVLRVFRLCLRMRSHVWPP